MKVMKTFCFVDGSGRSPVVGCCPGRNRFGRYAFSFILLSAVSLVSACRKSEPKADAQRGTSAHPFVIGMSQCNLGEPWRVQMNEDIRKAAESHSNLHVVFKDA